jgi:glycosyltransferase 2 family protein
LQAQSLSLSPAGQASLFSLGFGMITQGNLWKRASNKVVEFTRRIMSALALWLKQPRGLLLALACSWVNMLCLFAFLSLMFAGMGEPLPFWLIAGLYSMVYFVTLIPISINGYGLQEVSMTLVFSRFGGASVANGVTAALLFRTLMMLTSLPGALFLPAMLAGGRTEDKPGQP